jgi:hypothetical protein
MYYIHIIAFNLGNIKNTKFTRRKRKFEIEREQSQEL